MDTKRTFNFLEQCCFPKGCLIPKDHQPCLATVLIEQLEAVGMKPAEWTRGALMLEEPYLSKVKGIVCRPCKIHNCPFKPCFKSLSDLMDGRYMDRIERGDQLLAQLLPEAKKTELEQKGIKVIAFHMASRKNPKLVFVFTRNDNMCREVSCEVGNRCLCTNKGEETLISLEQLEQKIEEAVRGLIV